MKGSGSWWQVFVFIGMGFCFGTAAYYVEGSVTNMVVWVVDWSSASFCVEV